MRIEVLHVPGCPNLATTRSRLADALRIAGVTASVREVEVATDHDANRLGMRGSPTILIDGQDPFGTDAGPSLSCRLFRTDTGVEGAPAVADLLTALSR